MPLAITHCTFLHTYCTHTHTLTTHSLAHTLTHSLTHSLSHSLVHSFTHLYIHSLTFSLTHNCLSYTENRAGLEADALDRDSTADCQRLLHRQETDCRISQRGTQSNQHSTGLLFSLFSFVWPTVTFGNT